MRIAIAGAGLIGRHHARLVREHPRLRLTHVVDPHITEDDLQMPQVRIVDALEPILGELDGLIVATPNALHRPYALAAIEAGVPVLVEKPLAEDLAAAAQIVEAAHRLGTAVLVGHHRRYSPVLEQAVAAIEAGELGDIVAVNGLALFHKPDDYFEAGPWRTVRPGGGPVLINLIHDIDNLRALCGDIVRVHAVASSARRGFEVEDTAALTLQFASGALGTFLLSDVAASVWSWEQTAAENPRYDSAPDENCYHIAGTRGSIAVPTLRLRYYAQERSWWAPLTRDDLPRDKQDPLVRQLDHFGAVIAGEVAPRVTAGDALQTLCVIAAVEESARTGVAVDVVRGQHIAHRHEGEVGDVVVG